MSNIAKVRTLLETMRSIAPVLTEEEISDIGVILNRACNRLIKESEGRKYE